MSRKRKHQHCTEHPTPDEENAQPPKEALVRLPGFVNDDDIGLGDVLKAVTSAAGIKPCGGCQKRASVLNRLLSFTGKPGNR